MSNYLDYQPSQGRVTQQDAYLRQLATAPLNHWLQEFWQLNVPNGRYCYHSLPDNCVDLIINLTQPEDIIIVTPFTSSILFELSGAVSYFGIRFRPLGLQGLIDTPIGEFDSIDNLIEPTLALPEALLMSACEAAILPMTFDQRCQYFSQILLTHLRPCDIDKRLVRYIHYCHQHLGSCLDLSDKQCQEFGLSARQLRRLTSQYLALSPRAFAKIVKFQHCLKQLNHCKPAAKLDLPYYDQPHYIREFKKITGVTPNKFRQLSVLYNTD